MLNGCFGLDRSRIIVGGDLRLFPKWETCSNTSFEKAGMFYRRVGFRSTAARRFVIEPPTAVENPLQFTPKAFANVSPGFERSENPGIVIRDSKR